VINRKEIDSIKHCTEDLGAPEGHKFPGCLGPYLEE
jgi:hypothetical protein